MRLPGPRIVAADHVALRVTVEPVAVAYTTSRPARSTGPPPWLATSTNSSDADAPPVCTSETTSVDGGQPTAAARTPGPARPPAATTITITMSAVNPARRA